MKNVHVYLTIYICPCIQYWRGLCDAHDIPWPPMTLTTRQSWLRFDQVYRAIRIIEPLPMILLGEPLANYVTRLPMWACQWSENENWKWTTILACKRFFQFSFENDGPTLLFAFFKKSFVIKFLGKKTSFLLLFI